jgi:hypothetical protein
MIATGAQFILAAKDTGRDAVTAGVATGRPPQSRLIPVPTSAAILDSRTLRSTPERGERAGYDGAKRKKGSKLHLAADTLCPLLALHGKPANADERAEVGRLAQAVQASTGQSVELAYVDQGCTGECRGGGQGARQRHPLPLISMLQVKRRYASTGRLKF